METIISNLVGPGETLLIASRGIWDQRAFMMANRYGKFFFQIMYRKKYGLQKQQNFIFTKTTHRNYYFVWQEQ